MAVLTEMVDDAKDDCFAADSGQRLNEVHPNIGLDPC
jgi:hypothetical protein